MIEPSGSVYALCSSPLGGVPEWRFLRRQAITPLGWWRGCRYQVLLPALLNSMRSLAEMSASALAPSTCALAGLSPVFFMAVASACGVVSLWLCTGLFLFLNFMSGTSRPCLMRDFLVSKVTLPATGLAQGHWGLPPKGAPLAFPCCWPACVGA